jgi:large subunit ribosomal protein L22
VAGLTVDDAIQQLEFSKKMKAPLVQKIIRRTANLADIRHGLQYSQLEIAECFVTRGTPLKRLNPMGRGRMGLKCRQHSHIRIVLREIDFKLKIYQAKTLTEKKRWVALRQRAETEYAKVAAEREEIKNLENQVAVQTATQKKK